MLINEAIDAVLHARRVAGGHRSRDDQGRQLSEGSARVGQRDWAAASVLERIERLHAEYGEDRYRPSPLLRRMVRDGRPVLRMTASNARRRSGAGRARRGRDDGAATRSASGSGIEVVDVRAARRDGSHDGARRHAERLRRVPRRRRCFRSPTARSRSRRNTHGRVTVSIENSDHLSRRRSTPATC